MKKTFTLFLCMVASIMAYAQSDGFYRVQSTTGKNYCMVMLDNQSKIDGLNVDLDAIQLQDIKDLYTHPGSVIYIRSIGNSKYDIEAQGSSLGKLTGGLVYPQLVKQSDGSYTVWGSYGGVPFYLGATTTYLRLVDGSSDRKFWNLLPIDFKDNYIGIKPDIKTDDGNYWGTFYASFAFKLHSTGMEAYYVDGANDYTFTMKKLTGTIPPATPVIIKCSSDDPADNMIEPVTSNDAAQSGNKIHGIYFDNSESGHRNRTKYEAETMRVIGVHDGKLAFVKATTDYLTNKSYLPHNKCYLNVSAGAEETIALTDVLAIGSIETDNTKAEIYTLTGQKVPEGTSLRPGIYIRNGKKVVIK